MISLGWKEKDQRRVDYYVFIVRQPCVNVLIIIILFVMLQIPISDRNF